MEIIPPIRVMRFEQLDAGDLFLKIDGGEMSYAIKTAQPSNGDRSNMVLLGPTFIQDIKESFLIPWQSATVLSFRKNFSILLSTVPAAWSSTGPSRAPVCLAIAGDDAYICTNGAMSPRDYMPCYVDVKTGVIAERRPSTSIAFTNTWEIALLSAKHPPRSVLKYPLQ